ncbi:hypothetical protein PAXRUDRAFT_822852 [Paxillus rubicundulus Ve08.2h10]|uniref:Tetratricopeptide SHNi-TPR domain-containing protein n=1 Tax=Paxillus rubicundulus Ve08.2h10 TaxID=930991 RepID=A0A0D0DW34_9AGAM|nr:hypothetical protein PAXRUDRAFT_822852 [Paxillus rubicundulus Ve08.2h10]
MASESMKGANPNAPNGPKMTVENALEHARRAFALKKYEQAVEHYATALELQTKQYGEDAPETADLYFSYGKALLENAISQASVLGKEPEPGAVEDEKPTGGDGKGPILEFGDEGEGEDEAVDMFGPAAKEADEESEGEDEEGEEGGPEDDFNASWEVLELARAIYEKGQDEDNEIKLKLADTYITLGDVSLETEKFDQAIADYSAGLALKVDLLPMSSRQIAEAHYKLSMVLDLTSGRLSDAIVHAEEALKSVLQRIDELRDGLSGEPPAPVEEPKEDKKGKRKAKASSLFAGDLVKDMSKSQMEAELQELEGLKEDLTLKVDELKTTPTEPSDSAPAMAARALDQELNARSIAVPGQAAAVHDLTSMVKKKKKPAESEGGTKRKTNDDDGSPATKKAKLEDAAP